MKSLQTKHVLLVVFGLMLLYVLLTRERTLLDAIRLPKPTLLPASTIQATGWIITTATALYCVRTGRIQQHREWMMRSYPLLPWSSLWFV